MKTNDGFADFVVGQLAELGPVVARRMFGGVGLYHDGLFFAVLDDDVLYLKVSDETRPRYVARGMSPFTPFEDKPAMGGYYEVPEDVLEDPEELAEWAREAHAVAGRAAMQRPPRRKRAVRKIRG